jgi:hypothetical protein
LIKPNRENGTLNVVIWGVTWRITMTLVGSPVNNFEAIVNTFSSSWDQLLFFLGWLGSVVAFGKGRGFLGLRKTVMSL